MSKAAPSAKPSTKPQTASDIKGCLCNGLVGNCTKIIGLFGQHEQIPMEKFTLHSLKDKFFKCLFSGVRCANHNCDKVRNYYPVLLLETPTSLTFKLSTVSFVDIKSIIEHGDPPAIYGFNFTYVVPFEKAFAKRIFDVVRDRIERRTDKNGEAFFVLSAKGNESLVPKPLPTLNITKLPEPEPSEKLEEERRKRDEERRKRDEDRRKREEERHKREEEDRRRRDEEDRRRREEEMERRREQYRRERFAYDSGYSNNYPDYRQNNYVREYRGRYDRPIVDRSPAIIRRRQREEPRGRTRSRSRDNRRFRNERKRSRSPTPEYSRSPSPVKPLDNESKHSMSQPSSPQADPQRSPSRYRSMSPSVERSCSPARSRSRSLSPDVKAHSRSPSRSLSPDRPPSRTRSPKSEDHAVEEIDEEAAKLAAEMAAEFGDFVDDDDTESMKDDEFDLYADL